MFEMPSACCQDPPRSNQLPVGSVEQPAGAAPLQSLALGTSSGASSSQFLSLRMSLLESEFSASRTAGAGTSGPITAIKWLPCRPTKQAPLMNCQPIRWRPDSGSSWALAEGDGLGGGGGGGGLDGCNQVNNQQSKGFNCPREGRGSR